MSEQEVWVVEESDDGGPWLPTSDNYVDPERANIAASNAKVEDDWRRESLNLPGSADYRAACYQRVEVDQ